MRWDFSGMSDGKEAREYASVFLQTLQREMVEYTLFVEYNNKRKIEIEVDM